MKNSKALLHDFVHRITLQEDPEEVQSMAYSVFEHLFHLSRTDVLLNKEVALSAGDEQRLADIVGRINQHEPVQYILGTAWFFGRRYTVNSAVLIPRPETEELVQAILDRTAARRHEALRILDIGTGSGCIAISLALDIPHAKVYAADISPAALAVAAQNAQDLHAPVSFLPHDVLAGPLPFATLDVVVSNPPYIATREKTAMHPNVLDYEPHLALFVPDDDPLLFYRAIARQAFDLLVPQGLLAVEINALYATDVEEVFRAAGFTATQTLRDIPGKDRMVLATKP